MDLSGIEYFIPNIAAYFNVDPATILMLVGAICTIANVLSRVIPDDAIGFWGVVRKIASILGVYVSNRVSTGITTNDVIKKVVGGEVGRVANQAILEAASDAESLIPEVVQDGGDLVIPAFPGFQPRGPDGKFRPKGVGE